MYLTSRARTAARGSRGRGAPLKESVRRAAQAPHADQSTPGLRPPHTPQGLQLPAARMVVQLSYALDPDKPKKGRVRGRAGRPSGGSMRAVNVKRAGRPPTRRMQSRPNAREQRLPTPTIHPPHPCPAQYLMPMAFGSDQQRVNMVVDTGSASLHTCGYNPALSASAVNSNKQGILSYGSEWRLGLEARVAAPFPFPAGQQPHRPRPRLAP